MRKKNINIVKAFVGANDRNALKDIGETSAKIIVST